MALIDKIQTLHDELRNKYETSKSPYMARFIDFLFDSPIFTIPQLQGKVSLGVRLTAVRLVGQLLKDNVIGELQGVKGPKGSKLYAFHNLLSIIR